MQEDIRAVAELSVLGGRARYVQSEIATRLTSAFWAGDRLRKASRSQWRTSGEPASHIGAQVGGSGRHCLTDCPNKQSDLATEPAAFRGQETLPFDEEYFIRFCLIVCGQNFCST